MKNQQSGFTLIELVMVIVILGILAAFALPKFADLASDAEFAAAKGGRGAVLSAAGIAHAAYLAAGSNDPSIEGFTYTMVNGYPIVEEISTLANLDGFSPVLDTASDPATATITLSGGSTCVFVYTEAVGIAAPVVGAVSCP